MSSNICSAVRAVGWQRRDLLWEIMGGGSGQPVGGGGEKLHSRGPVCRKVAENGTALI